MEGGMRSTLALVWVVRTDSDGAELRSPGRGGRTIQKIDLRWVEEESWGAFAVGQDSLALDVEVEDVVGLDAQGVEDARQPARLCIWTSMDVLGQSEPCRS